MTDTLNPTKKLLEWDHPTTWTWTAGIYKISNHSNDAAEVFVLESGDEEGHDYTYLTHATTPEQLKIIAQAIQDAIDGVTPSDATLSNLEAIVASLAEQASGLERAANEVRALLDQDAPKDRITTLEWKLDGGWETTNGAPWFFMVPYGSKGNFKARLTQDIDLGTADSDVAKELLQQVQDVLDGVIPVPSPQTIIAALEKEIANLATYLETDPPEMNEDTLSEISGLQNAIGIIQALEYHRSIIDGGVLQSTKDV